MKKKERARWEKRVRQRLRDWSFRLYLTQMWQISPEFDWDDSRKTSLGNGTAGATAHPDPVYMQAHIEFHMQAIVAEDMNDDQLDYMIVHELMHLLLAEKLHTIESPNEDGEMCAPQDYMEAEERAAEHLGRRFVWLWKDGS